MTDDELIMEFAARHPLMLESVLERAITEAIMPLFPEASSRLSEKLMRNVRHGVFQTLTGEKQDVSLDDVKCLESRLRGEQKLLEVMMQELTKRVARLEEDEDGANWWKATDGDDED